MDRNYYDIFEPVLTINLVLNLIFTILTLYIIKKLNNYNGYIHIIYGLTISQFIFESSSIIYFNIKLPVDSDIRIFILDIFVLSSGIMSSLYAFLLCALLSYVVLTRKYFDSIYYRHFINFSFIIIALSIDVIAFYFTMMGNTNAANICFALYDYIRIIIPFIIIFLLLYVKYTMNSMKLTANHPINILFIKLSIYPIVATLSRLPVWFFQVHYNIESPDYENVINPSLMMSFLYLLSILTYPSAGLGNFYAFYINNPECKSILWSLITNQKYIPKINENISSILIRKASTKPNRDSSMSSNKSRMSRLSFFYNSNNDIDESIDGRLNINDFEYEENVTFSNPEVNYEDLDEEQLCRHIALSNRENGDNISLMPR